MEYTKELANFSEAFIKLANTVSISEKRLTKIEKFLEKIFREDFYNADEKENFTGMKNKDLKYKKSTTEMIDACYTYGKMAYENQVSNVREYADAVEKETGMNRSSAIIYIYVVKNMLDGNIFKRAVSLKSIKYYFEKIMSEYGKVGLKNAVKATRMHAKYRSKFGHPVLSIIKMCDEYSL